LALARVFGREVWKFYARSSFRLKFIIEIKEKEECALRIICMRLAPA
jgi:hypothetical protein